jgi:outer membrane protein TolC
MAIAQETPSESQTNPAPGYLDPDSNPLLFPTQPDEVEITGTQPITLEQALELAERNNRQLQLDRIELERRTYALREAQAANLPTLSLSSDLSFDENTSGGTDGLDFDGITGGNRTTTENQDDINTNLSGSVSLDYNLFTSGQRSANIRASEGQVRLQELIVEQTTEQLRRDVASDYYDLQQADAQIELAQSALEREQRNLRDTEAQRAVGLATRLDVLQAEVSVANAQQELVSRQRDQRVAQRQLARQLSVPEQVTLASADAIAIASEWPLSLEESIVLGYRNRAELEQQLVQRDINEQQRRAALGELGPQLGLFAQYQVSDELNQSSEARDAYSFGARFNLLLFDGGAAIARARQRALEIESAEVSFADQRNAVRLEVETAFEDLRENEANIPTSTLALEQAREALRLASLRFQSGVGTQLEVLQAQRDLTEAELNQLNAILGYNRALLDLQRSVSSYSRGL